MTSRPPLTREAVLAMPAGRDLDALVAEHVMSWLRIADCEPFRFHVEAGGVITSTGPEKFTVGVIPEPWYPSRALADAWQVVEKLQAQWIRMLLAYGGEECPSWAAKFHADGYRSFQDQEWSASADTAPLAICRAALLTVLA